MTLHANAALSLNGRRQLARRVVEEGCTLVEAAAAEVSVRCAPALAPRLRAQRPLATGSAMLTALLLFAQVTAESVDLARLHPGPLPDQLVWLCPDFRSTSSRCGYPAPPKTQCRVCGTRRLRARRCRLTKETVRLAERLDVDERAGCGLASVLLGEAFTSSGGRVGFGFGFEHVAKSLRVGGLVDARLANDDAVGHPTRLPAARVEQTDRSSSWSLSGLRHLARVAGHCPCLAAVYLISPTKPHRVRRGGQASPQRSPDTPPTATSTPRNSSAAASTSNTHKPPEPKRTLRHATQPERCRTG